MMKRFGILAATAVVLMSCSTMGQIMGAATYDKPKWGQSGKSVEVASVSPDADGVGTTANLAVSVVPRENAVVLNGGRGEPGWMFPDRMGSIGTLKAAVTKFQEWSSKVDGSGADVTKEIAHFVVWMHDAPTYLRLHVRGDDGKFQLQDDEVFVVASLVTVQDKTYQLQLRFMVYPPKADYQSEDNLQVGEPREVDTWKLSEKQAGEFLLALDETAFKTKAAEQDAMDAAVKSDADAKATKDKAATDSLQ
jgi:hypothetical protein